MPLSLTRAQHDCLCVYVELTDALGRRPTLAEVAHEMDICARSSALRLLLGIRERGWLGADLTILHRPRLPDFGHIELRLEPGALEALAMVEAVTQGGAA